MTLGHRGTAERLSNHHRALHQNASVLFFLITQQGASLINNSAMYESMKCSKIQDVTVLVLENVRVVYNAMQRMGLNSTIAQVIELTALVPQPVRARVQWSHGILNNRDQAVSWSWVLSKPALHTFPRASFVSA